MGIRLTDCAQNYLAEVSLSGKARSLDSARRALDRIVLILGKVPLADLQPAHVHLVADVIGPRVPKLGPVAAYAKQAIRDKLIEHAQYIREHGEDLPEVRDWRWQPDARTD